MLLSGSTVANSSADDLLYRSLPKEHPWVEHLTSLGGRSFELTTKERPCHVYSDSKPSKQIIGHKNAKCVKNKLFV